MNPSAWLTENLYKYFGLLYQPVEQADLLGKPIKVIKGSIRHTADYDDGWLLALGYHSRLVFDIGCNIGQASLIMLFPDVVERVVMVDPNPRALAIAAENMMLNHLSHKIGAVCAFASDRDGGQVPFYTVGSGAAGSMYRSHAKSAARIHASFLVPTISVDWLCKWYDCIPDLVKIDVEGAEAKVLQGSSELARKHRTKFFVEMHSSSEMPMSRNAELVLKWCGDHHYGAWYLKDKQRLVSCRTIEHRGRCHLLLLPDVESLPDYLIPIEQGHPLLSVLSMLNGNSYPVYGEAH